MSKKEELDVQQNPQFLYQLTQNYMLGYVKARGTKEDRVWYAKLGLANQKKVTRAGKDFEVLDIQKVREEFVKRFFPNLLERKKNGAKKPTYKNELEALLAEAEAEAEE